MCGGCGTVVDDWAMPYVGGEYARGVVASTLTGIVSRVTVRSTPGGWTVSRVSGRTEVYLTLDSLVGACIPALRIVLMGDAATQLHAHISALPPHRPFPLNPVRERDVCRGAVPALVSRADRNIHAVLGAAVLRHLRQAGATGSLGDGSCDCCNLGSYVELEGDSAVWGLNIPPVGELSRAGR